MTLPRIATAKRQIASNVSQSRRRNRPFQRLAQSPSGGGNGHRTPP